MTPARNLQQEYTGRNIDFDHRLALQLQQNEPLTVANTSADVELACRLQEEENQKKLSQLDQTLAEQYQQAEIPHASTSKYYGNTVQTMLQPQQKRHTIFETDLELAHRLQQEEVCPNTDSDVALALRLQNEENATPDVDYKDIELARKLQEEENERNRILAEHTAKDLEMAQKLQEEMRSRYVSEVTASNVTARTPMTSPRAEITELSMNKPSEWQEQSELQTTEVFSVPQESVEWTKVEQKFKSTLSNQIVSISRIQNKWLWDFYCFQRKKLHEKNNGAINEMELFHGTRQNNPKLIYEGEQSFDMRFSKEGMWGRANYFAVNASYSSKYAFSTPDGCKEIFLAKVLTGESYSSAPNSKLCKPRQKPHGSAEQNMLFPTMDYDTVSGHTSGSQVFMTYDNSKAYPAYVIKYR